MGGGRKIPYPKHVWSPTGGWYAQPKNWKSNTVIAGVVMFAMSAVIWKFSNERQTWARKPEPWEWHPSRYWSKQLIEWEKEDRLKAEAEKAEALKAEALKADPSKAAASKAEVSKAA